MPMEIVTDEDFGEYRSRCKSYINYHSLATYMRSPAVYWAEYSGIIEKRDSDAMAFGRAFHTLALESRGVFDDQYTVTDGPINEKTGKPYGRDTQAWARWAAEQTGEIVCVEDYHLMDLMHTHILLNEDARGVLFGAGQDKYYECTLRGDIDGIPAHGRIDAWCGEYIADLKTCECIDDFEKDIKRRQYDMQLAFYSMLLDELGEQNKKLILIAVEKQAPYRTGTWQMSENNVLNCKGKLRYALKQLDQSHRTGLYPTGYEVRRIID